MRNTKKIKKDLKDLKQVLEDKTLDSYCSDDLVREIIEEYDNMSDTGVSELEQEIITSDKPLAMDFKEIFNTEF